MKTKHILGLILGLIVVATTTRATEGWETAQQNPKDFPITIVPVNILAETNSWVNIRIADASIFEQGAGCDIYTNADPFTVHMARRRQYVLTVEASEFTSMDLQVVIQNHWVPLSSSGKNSQPRGMGLLVDGEYNADAVIGINNYDPENQCSYTSNSYTIELIDLLPYNLMQEIGSNDPKHSPGDGSFANIGPGDSLDVSQEAFGWSVSLGRLKDGTSAGRLAINESKISAATFTPDIIYHDAISRVARDNVHVVYRDPGSTNVLRQLQSCQTFVDIVPVTHATELRFYQNDQIGPQTNGVGWYTNITGQPFVVWCLTNPVATWTNQLNIIERRNTGSGWACRTNQIIYNQTNSTTAAWVLKYGSGAEERVETRSIQITNVSGVTNRIEIDDVRYAGATDPTYRAIEKYRLFPWGWEFVENRVDPDNNSGTDNDLVTTVTFNTDTNYDYSYRQPYILTYPDGYWEKRVYDDSYLYGALRNVILPDRSTVTNPADATFENSTWQRFTESGDGTISEVQWIHHGDYTGLGGFWFKAHSSYGIPWDGDQQYSVDGCRQEGVNADGGQFLGPQSLSADEDQGIGYFNHTYWKYDSQHAAEVSYFHGGTYNAVSRTFTGVTTDVANSPDYRICTLYGYQDSHNGMWDYEDWLFPTSADGELLHCNNDGLGPWVGFFANRSWRNTFIYHNGSLTQKEMSVVTGMNENGTLNFETVTTWVYQNDSLGHATNITQIDNGSGVSKLIYSANYQGTNSVDGELLQWEIDLAGTKTLYTYDSLNRIATKKKEGIAAAGGFSAQSDITTTYKYDTEDRALSITNSSAGLSVSTATAYDIAGRAIAIRDTNGLTTSISYDLGGRKTTTTLPSGSTEIRENYIDRQLKSVTGTAVVNEYHDWVVEDWATRPSEYNFRNSFPWMFTVSHSHHIVYGAENSTRERIEGLDFSDRVVRTEMPDYYATNKIIDYTSYTDSFDSRVALPTYTVHQWSYNSGQTELHDVFYDIDGSSFLTGVDPNVYPSISDSTTARETMAQANESDVYFAKVGDSWFRCTTNYIFLADNDATPTISTIKRERLSGFSSGNILSEVTTWDADTNATIVTTIIDRSAKKTTEITDAAQSALNATNITVNGLLQASSTLTVATPSLYYYDALGHLTVQTSSLGFSAVMTYDQFGRIQSSQDASGVKTTFQYYSSGPGAGQISSEDVGGKKTYHSYTARGESYRTWGDVPYPEERIYSQFGELTDLHTFRGGAGWAQSTWPASPGTYDSTTWHYQEHSGFLTNKSDAAGHSVWFAYEAGRLQTRRNARGATSTYSYEPLGKLSGIDYDDGTPSIAFASYDRRGNPVQITDATGAATLKYDHAGRIIANTCDSGLFSGVIVTNHFASMNGRDGLALIGVVNPQTNRFGYDVYGRLGSVTNGNYSAVYGYLDNSDLVQTTTCRSNAATILTSTKAFEFGTRIVSVANSVDGNPIASFQYAYDELSRRSKATLEDGSSWQYGYNDRNELAYSRRYWVDAKPVTGQQFAYSYDNIGNRISSASGGDTYGGNLRAVTYSANSINQYTNIVTPGYKDIVGAALATNSVTVNGATADRDVEYFHREIPVSNAGGPLWATVTTISSDSTNQGGFVHPKNNQILTYDSDGNLINDGVWSYEWDAENRLKAMTMTNVTGIPNAQRKRLEFVYNYMGCRAQKTVLTWDGSDFVSVNTNRFVYDGWNLIAVLNPTNSVLQSFTWGVDVRGAEPGSEEDDSACGIGGLLMENISGTNNFAAFDGSGNVIALVNSDKSVTARYEYSSFGELIRSTGNLASQNPFRFSTKFYDDESGLVYYGYRYYVPSVGRWLGRDPLQEVNAINLYIALKNSPLNYIDPDGRFFVDMLIALLIDDAEETSDAIKGSMAIKKVKDLVSRLNAIQSFMDGYMTADDLMEGGGLDDMIAAVEKAKQNLRGGNHRHHLIPQEFKDVLKGIKNLDVDELTAFVNGKLHLSLHGAGYNKVVGDFIKKNINRIKKQPMFLIGFVTGIMKNVGLGDSYLNPLSYM